MHLLTYLLPTADSSHSTTQSLPPERLTADATLRRDHPVVDHPRLRPIVVALLGHK